MGPGWRKEGVGADVGGTAIDFQVGCAGGCVNGIGYRLVEVNECVLHRALFEVGEDHGSPGPAGLSEEIGFFRIWVLCDPT